MANKKWGTNRYKKAQVLLVLGLFCFGFLFSGSGIKAQTQAELRQQLQAQMDELQKQINEYEQKIAQKQGEAKTLQRELSILTSQISKIELEVRQLNYAIQDTEGSITEKNNQINDLSLRIIKQKDTLAAFIRIIYEYDSQGLMDILLTRDNFSDFFNEINAVESAHDKLQKILEDVKALKTDAEQQKSDLENQIDELGKLKSIQELQKNTLSSKKGEKNNLLKLTKGEEAQFLALEKAAKQDAAAIRNQIYTLDGLGVSLSLEKAYEYAKYAGDLTGVRPAFLLAELKIESNLGANVGTGHWQTDMRPADKDAFLQICSELGLDPNTTPVSRKPSYGWGGAMGPAQFLPTTWLSYKERVAKATGHNPPNPWHIDDAFTASAIKLANAGASAKTYEAEWKAAMIYFAGSNWNKSKYAFYGNRVMEMAGIIQDQLTAMGK